jgi:uncharacterized phiE125 gp8 family phage protein
MKWSLKRTSGSQVLPVSVSELKDHLNVAQSDISQDAKIESLIVAAKERIERDIDRILMTSTFVYYGPSFSNPLRINLKPVTSILSVRYYDADGVLTTLDPADYRFVESSQELVPAIGKTFPTPCEGMPDSVQVEFTAGYGADADCMPRLIQAAIKLCVGKWFYDPAQESSALHSQEMAYRNIVNILMRDSYP